MKLDEAIRSRRTVRAYMDKPISMKILRKILAAGCSAPSVHNMQPWHFYLLRHGSKQQISDIMLKRSASEFVFIRTVLRENAEIIQKAPVALVLCNVAPLSKKLKRLGNFYEKHAILWESQSIACCIENMLLSAWSMGIGGAIIGCALLCEKEIKAFLDTKESLMAVIVLGYPKEGIKHKNKKIKKDIMEIA
jgi:nitroreductase